MSRRVADEVDQHLARYTERGVPLLAAILAGIRELKLRGATVDRHGQQIVRELERRAERVRRGRQKRSAPRV